MIILFFSNGINQNTYAQEKQKKTRYEKIQEKKNKANRRLKRRGDKSRKGIKNFFRFGKKNRQGDQPYKGDIAGRKVRSRISPTNRSRAVTPPPNPYAGRKRSSEAARAKAFKRNIRYSQKPRERAWKGNISGDRLINKGARSERSRLQPQPPSKRRTGATERDGARFSGQGFKRFLSISGRSKGAKKDKRIVPRSASRRAERDGARLSGQGFKGIRSISGKFKGAKSGRVTPRSKSVLNREKDGTRLSGQGFKRALSISGRSKGGDAGKVTPRSASRRSERDGSRLSGQGFKGVRSISGRSANALKKKRIVPRSASGAYTVRKKKKPYAWRERSKWESAYQGDITGRKFKAKPPSTEVILQKQPKVRFSFQGKGRKGDRAYKGQIKAGYKSVTSGKERAWKGDISGTKLRKRTSERPKFNDVQFNVRPQGKRRGDKAYKGMLPGGGYKTTGKRTERAGEALPRKPISGRIADAVSFQGNIKTKRPDKGGGSISTRWNNNGKPIQGRGLKSQDLSVARFQGNLKRRKPLKGGGGSISGDRWNNKGRAIQGRPLQKQDQQVAGFQGNIKGTKPGRGIFNKKEALGMAKYQGNMKQWKYKTGPLDELKWEGRFKRKKAQKNPNADKNAIKGKGLGDNDRAMAGFTGNIKQWKYKTGPLDEMKWEGRFKRAKKPKRNPNVAKDALLSRGLGKNDKKMVEFTGNLKRPKYVRNPNSDKESLLVKKLRQGNASEFQGNVKLTTNYKRNPNSSKEALPGIAPTKASREGNQFQGRFKQTKNYKRNPNSSKEALLSIAPSSETKKGSEFQGRFKMTKNYKQNPYASKNSLKKIGPSRAAISASNFQGNLKMKKGRVGDKHPSYKFLNHQDTGIAKTKFSLKVLWSRLFKKSENQPDFLKEKERKPRYDKNEKGLWNE